MAGIYDVRRQMRRLTQPTYTTAATSTRARSPYDLLKDLQKFVQPYAREQGGMTQTQRETLPYLEKIKAQKERSRGLLQPVEAILDILNRGQYVTANIAQQITDNMNQGQEWWVGIPEAVKQGLTGERKGDWEKVLFGGELSGKEIKGWVPWRPETKAGKFAKGVAGFAANVLLDPTTYIGFGPATGARSAATKYADDVVRISMREIGQNAPEMLPKLIQSGYDSTKFTELLAKNAPEGFAYLTKYAGQDISKYMSRVWNRSYRDALRKPAEELTQGMTKRINDVLEKMTGKEVSTKLTGAADLGLKQLPGKVAPISESERLVEMLQKLEGKPYAGAGTRAGRFMRKEFAVGERNPTWLQAMDQMRDRFTQSKIGGMFSDAWWSVMNSQRSPIGKLKRLLHVRNPYQKMLSIMERDISYDTANSAMLKGERLRKIFEPMSQDQRDEVLGSMLMSQVMQEKARRTGQTAVDATVVARRLADEKNSEVVVDAINKINAVTKEWDSYNDWAFRIGVAPETGTWHDYLPIQQTTSEAWKKSGTQLGSAHPGWTRAREMGWGEHLEQELETIKWMLGVDSKTAARALKEGVGDINVNLENMLMRRAFAQARFEQHVDMVLKFREFGIDVKSLQKTDPKVYERLTSKWGRLEPLGLKSMEGVPGLEGYLFDSDVIDIFERAIKVSSSDRNLNAAANVWRSFTSWWRGWATLSPGFHLRNFYSNNVTGFLKHGVEWLDPRVHGEAFMAAVVGLHGYDEGVKRLTKIFPEDLVKKTLARRVSGGASLAELAEYGGRTGIATRMSMGFGEPKTYEDVVRMEGKLLQNVNVNPFSGDFSGFKVSREAGAYIESTSKMQSFILDYRRAMKQGGNAQAAAEWAKTEARKWWIDYGDLTQFEQGLREVIPFYTWIRNNVSNQITGMMQFKEMYSLLPKATEAAGIDMDRRELPDWMRELGMIPIAETQQGLYKMFWPNFPYQDLNQIPVKFRMVEGLPVPSLQDPWETVSDIAQDAHPVIKNAIEVIGNVDIFYREPMGDVRKAPRLMRALTKAPGALLFLDGLMRGLGFQNGLRVDVNAKGQLMIDSRMGKILEDNILILNRLPQFWDAPELLFPALETIKQRVTGAVDDYEGTEEIMQTISFYLGVKTKMADVEEERFRRNQELIEEAQAARRKEQRYTPQHTTRSLKWRQQQTKMQRKLGL